MSYALNGTRPISEETRQRIFKAIEELGYKPHALARGLASKRSRIIALLFPNTDRGLGFTELEFVTSAANAAKENQYSLVLWSYDVHDLNELRQLTQQRLVDGVVVMEVHEHDARIDMLRQIEFPFSMIGRSANMDGLDYVDIDFSQTVRDAVDHLVELERARERRQDRVQGIQPVADVVGEVENQQEGVFVWQAPDPHAKRMDVIQTLVERDDHLVGKVFRVTEVRLPAHFDDLTLKRRDELQCGAANQRTGAIIEVLLGCKGGKLDNPTLVDDDDDPVGHGKIGVGAGRFICVSAIKLNCSPTVIAHRRAVPNRNLHPRRYARGAWSLFS